MNIHSVTVSQFWFFPRRKEREENGVKWKKNHGKKNGLHISCTHLYHCCRLVVSFRKTVWRFTFFAATDAVVAVFPVDVFPVAGGVGDGGGGGADSVDTLDQIAATFVYWLLLGSAAQKFLPQL